MNAKKYKKFIDHCRRQSDLLARERFSEYRLRALAKANGADNHDLNGKLGVISMAIELARGGNKSFIHFAEEAIKWVEEETKVIGNIYWFVEL